MNLWSHRIRRIRTLRLLSAVVAGFAPGAASVCRGEPLVRREATTMRVVHRFDFDERDDGNLEEVPKFWDMLRPEGFPHFVNGGFDLWFGHNAPPSFYLESAGRNVAYGYAGPDTRIRVNTDYRIEGFIRADRLVYARACLSAHFVDREGVPIPDTLVRSPFVGGTDDASAWTRVDLYLNAPPREAHGIGLVAWVLQEPMWYTSPPPSSHIPRCDVHGGAWFDDITIFALPFVDLRTAAPGNVFSEDIRPELLVALADHEDTTLFGTLRIQDAGGSVVVTRDVPVVLDPRADPQRVDLSALPPGLYRARLNVFAGSLPLASRTLTFIRLGPRLGPVDVAARGFGVVLESERADMETEMHLLRHLLVRSAKVPMWTGPSHTSSSLQASAGIDRFLQGLVKNGFALTAVFAGPPAELAGRDDSYVRPLLELLAGDRAAWSKHLAAVVAPYAGIFRWWQVGADDAPLTPDDRGFSDAMTNLRDAMGSYLTSPRLSAPLAGSAEPLTAPSSLEQITVAIGPNDATHAGTLLLDRYRGAGFQTVSAFLPAPRPEFERTAELSRWAQSVLELRHAGANTVFTSQPWHNLPTARGEIAEPQEFYLILRTLADVVAVGEPGPRLRLGDGVTALSFCDAAECVLALWDASASPAGRDHRLQLGRATRRIDMWGKVHRLSRDAAGRQSLTLSPMPVLVDGMERWMVELAASMSLEPARVESGTELVEHTLRMNYRGARPVSGEIRLETPDGWIVSPRVFAFHVMPQRSFSQQIRVRYPHNEPAGVRNFIAHVAVTGEGYQLDAPLPVEIGLTDLEIAGLGVLEGDDIVFRQVVSNRSRETLSFRASASVPGRERQYRPISELRPGDTHVVEYRFTKGRALSGSEARLMLREVGDGQRMHNMRIDIP
jgi:hypothetical protein